MAARVTPASPSPAQAPSFEQELPTECAWCGRMVRVFKAHPWMSGGVATVIVGFIVLIAVLDVASKVIICAGVLGVAGLVFWHSRKNGNTPLNTSTLVAGVKAMVSEAVGTSAGAVAVAPRMTPEAWLKANRFTKTQKDWVFLAPLTRATSTDSDRESLLEEIWDSLRVPSTITKTSATYSKSSGDDKSSSEHGFFTIHVMINATGSNPFAS